MKKCRNCGQEVSEEAKFCPKCGSAINNTEDDYGEEEYYGEPYDDYDQTDEHDRKSISKVKIAAGIFIVIFILIAGAVGVLKYKEFSEKNKREIELVNVNIADYPNIKIEIKASNYNEKLNKDNLSVKENDVYPKDVDLKADEQEENEYIISYTSTEKDSGGNVDVNVAYTEDGKEVALKTSYDAPDTLKEQQKTYSGKANGDNSVNTYDDNEVLVKNAVDKYEKAYIQMIDHKDTYYIKSAIDLSGGLVSEFEKTISSYKEQDIDETLKRYNVENITKVSDDKYDVTVYEEYYIYYGKKHENKNEDFRTRYIVDRSGSEFKVYSIKNIEKI